MGKIDLYQKIYFGIKISGPDGYDFNYEDKNYNINVIGANREEGFNIPYVLITPKDIKEGSTIALESNNLETIDANKLQFNAITTALNLEYFLKDYDVPVVVPIIPSMPSKPYYQQLSRGCFDNRNPKSLDYRYDLQVKKIILDAKEQISKKTNVNVDDRVFLNGYSASGVFAQRFALLHPRLVKATCIGGASGSIPVPSSNIDYPIGIKDYASLTHKDFDLSAYRDIKFNYYVGSLETDVKSKTRKDEDGNLAPMHDMSYFDRSVPELVGKKQRELFGKDMFVRAQNSVDYLNNIDVNVNHTILDGYAHNADEGLSIIEKEEEFVKDAYSQNCIKKLEK